MVAAFMECGRVSYRFSSGTHSLTVFVERRNEFRLKKTEATRFSTPHANLAIRRKIYSNIDYFEIP
jgi:hypothetical protein